MWIVRPSQEALLSFIVDTILQCAHLIPVFGQNLINQLLNLSSDNSFDTFIFYYVNKYADHSLFLAFFYILDWFLLLERHFRTLCHFYAL
jgi:hypothetical protein